MFGRRKIEKRRQQLGDLLDGAYKDASTRIHLNGEWSDWKHTTSTFDEGFKVEHKVPRDSIIDKYEWRLSDDQSALGYVSDPIQLMQSGGTYTTIVTCDLKWMKLVSV